MTARRAPGGVFERRLADGDISYAIRFRAYGKRKQYALGTKSEGMTREDAERTLAYTIEQIRRGEWIDPESVGPPGAATCPTFAEFADRWLDGVRQDEKSPGTIAAYTVHVNHLKAYFGETPLSEIKPGHIDAYKRGLIAKRRASGSGLGNNSINKTITRLRQIMDEAIEHEIIDRNPAESKNRRVDSTPPKQTVIDTVDGIDAVIRAAGQLGRKVTPGKDRALVATGIFSGARIEELLTLRWSDVDLKANRLHVNGTKSPAAKRVVDIVPALHDELLAYAAAAYPHDADPREVYLFGTRDGTGKDTRGNVNKRIVKPAVEIANRELRDRGLRMVDPELTPHGLRRTYASLLIGVGTPITYVSRQMGHANAGVTMEIYAKFIEDIRSDADKLQALIDGEYRARSGTNEAPAHQPDATTAAAARRGQIVRTA